MGSIVSQDRAEEQTNPLPRTSPLAVRAAEDYDDNPPDMARLAAAWRLWNDIPEPIDPWSNL